MVTGEREGWRGGQVGISGTSLKAPSSDCALAKGEKKKKKRRP
jgi:hypothetical protein